MKTRESHVHRYTWVAFVVLGLLAASPASQSAPPAETSDESIDPSTQKIRLSDAEWKRRLTRQQYKVTRKHGTERAFSGKHVKNKRDGIYKCVCCGQPVFDSTTKFDSGTGWPSFYLPIGENQIGTSTDNKLFYTRIEVHCSRCDAHLGHVFNDGPAPTGLRYCINSVALDFEARTPKAR